jgi:putative transposase
VLRVRTSDLRRLLATGTRAPKRDDLLSPEQLARRDFGLKILSWYRDLIAKKYDGSARRGAGRPASAAAVQQLVVRFASGNPSWGTTRIRGALRNLGHELGRNTIKRIVLDHGLEPAPARRKRMPWKTFLKAHLGAICAVDLRHAVTEFVEH